MAAPRTNHSLRQKVIDLKREFPNEKNTVLAHKAKVKSMSQFYYFLKQFKEDTKKKEAQDDSDNHANDGQVTS